MAIYLHNDLGTEQRYLIEEYNENKNSWQLVELNLVLQRDAL